MKKLMILTGACTSLLLGACSSENKQEQQKLMYPKTKKVDHVDQYFGTQVPDPYRWLEDDKSEQTGQWVDEQIAFTQKYLSQITFNEPIKKRLTELWNYEKFSAPFKKGDFYYFYLNNGLQNQSILYRIKDLKDEPEVFVDPNQWSTDGTVALGSVSFSRDNKYMAYQVSQGGSDWQTIKIMSTQDKSILSDELKWVKFSGIAWKGDGFFYSRYEQPKEGDELKGASEFQKIYFHKVGTSQQEDVLVFEDQQNPKRGFGATTSKDESLLVITPWEGTSGNMLIFKDLKNPNAQPQIIVDNFQHDHSFVAKDEQTVYLLTNMNAPNKRLVAIDLKKPQVEHWKDIIPNSDQNLQGVTIAGGKIFANYLIDARTSIKQLDKKGKLEREVQLPGIGTASGFDGDADAKTLFYTFTSFTVPSSVYQFEVLSGTSTLFRQAKVAFNPDDFETKQVFYTSKDGTKVPMFIVHKKGLELSGTNPTYLYSYGGFNISMTPAFSPKNILWLENGGVYAQPSIRGGGEYGDKWHKAGTKMQKINVFDDFIAAAEYLFQEKYTSKDFLAIEGRSNGGLLVGATMTMRPDICKVAYPGVGVLDMLRFQHFTIGRAWSTDYGNSEESQEMFEYLKSYSPLHNIKAVAYPATMVNTADHDDRVVPAHSFKFIATLQEKNTSDAPMLIRIDKNAGHGAGKPTAMQIQEWADRYAFAYFNMGINPYQAE